jgi:putative FmdB family regulatory protein
MPLYEYECQKCGVRFEEIQKFSDPLLTEHDDCGGVLKKLLSAPAIQFKGTGWYVTDYAKSGQPEKDGKPIKKNGKGDSNSEQKAESKSESKSDSKSETKTEKKGSGDSSSSSSAKTSSDSPKK